MIGSDLFTRRRTGMTGVAVLAHEDTVRYDGRRQGIQPTPFAQILAQAGERVLSPRLAGQLIDVTLLTTRDGGGNGEARGVYRGHGAHARRVAVG